MYIHLRWVHSQLAMRQALEQRHSGLCWADEPQRRVNSLTLPIFSKWLLLRWDTTVAGTYTPDRQSQNRQQTSDERTLMNACSSLMLLRTSRAGGNGGSGSLPPKFDKRPCKSWSIKDGSSSLRVVPHNSFRRNAFVDHHTAATLCADGAIAPSWRSYRAPSTGCLDQSSGCVGSRAAVIILHSPQASSFSAFRERPALLTD
jgi:hypothetical protein